MTVDATAVLEYIGADSEELLRAQNALDVATALVDTFIGNSVVPESIRDQAYLDTSMAVWHRQNTVTGAVSYGFEGGENTAFVPKDVMSKSYPLLRPFVKPF